MNSFDGRARMAIRLALIGITTVGCQGEPARAPRPPRLPLGAAAPAEVIDWVRSNAVPFRGEAPTDDDSDLAPLDAILGKAEVVGLGEATHGTRQFFLMKHRLVRTLVSRKGFRVFLMEADGAGSCAIDDYVHGGEEDPRQLLRDLKFWTWNTQEFLDLLRWMRSYNQSAELGESIHFYGMDMQNPRALSQKVVTSLRRFDPIAAAKAKAAYGCLGPLDDHDALEQGYLLQKDVGEQKQCAAAIERVFQQLSATSPPLEIRSRRSFSCALWNARLMVQAERLLRFPSTRDSLYAETVLALQENERGNGLILWAHNGHISNSKGAMGRTVKRRLGDRYAIVGFTAYSGEFRARLRQPDGGAGPPLPVAAALPPVDSYEAAFHQTGLPRFFLDLRRLRSSLEAPAWLRGAHPLRDVGGAYDRELANSLVDLPEEFDALVFFDRGSASRLFPSR